MKILKSSKGMSLVEVLAILIVSSVAGLLVFNMVANAISIQEKVTLDTQLRDEADYYMVNLTNTIYTSTFCGEVKQPIGTTGSYIESSTNCSNNSIPKKKTGFLQEVDGSKSLYIEDKKISGSNQNISISSTSSISKTTPNVYTINLELVVDGKAKKFKQEIQSIAN